MDSSCSFVSTFAMRWSTVTLNREGLARHVGRRLLSSNSHQRLSSTGDGNELRLAAEGENHRA